VIFNRVGSAEHARILCRAADDRFAQPVLGCLPHDPDLVLPERHLGLLQPDEVPGLGTRLERLADTIDAHLDHDRLLRIARPFGIGLFGPRAQPVRPLGQRIALARDRAFAFVYEPVLDGWRTGGAEILPFSPLAGEAPDARADAIYLPGGYPELHAGRLANSASFLDGLRRAAARGAAIYGECGGFMVLGRTLIDADGTAHAMAGLLPVTTSFERPQLHLGYRRLRLRETGPLGAKHATFRGHEFHFARVVGQAPAPALFDAVDVRGRRIGPEGARMGSVAGSFLHLVDRSSEPLGTFERPSGSR
jgi:cobyrinic acid a,c-diamide synthase